MSAWIKRHFALFVLLIALGFYLCTLAPVVTFVDSGELAAVIATRGVAHPPGFPLYLLLGSFVALFPFGTLIWRLNAFSAVCAAISVAVTCQFFLRISSQPLLPKTKAKKKGNVPLSADIDLPWAGASAAALAWMTNRALWSTATVTEVYALHALLLTLFCYLLISYSRADNPAKTRYFALTCLIAGLGLSNYPPFGLLAPGAALYFYRIEKRIPQDQWRSRLWLLLLIPAGLLPYVLLPLRAQSGPLLNWGNPETLDLFWKHVSAAQYKIFLGPPDFSLLPKAFSLWWDQWPAAVWLLLIPGSFFLFRFRRDEFYLLCITGAANIFYVLSYDISDVSSAPSDFYAYLLPLCWVSSVWIGAGVQWAVFAIRKMLRETTHRLAAAALITAVPCMAAFSFWQDSNRREYYYADDFARSILNSMPQDALLLSPDWTFVSPALYLQHAEKVRLDVVVLNTELLRRSWYFDYLHKRAPWLEGANQNEIRAFLTDLAKYESGQSYDAAQITKHYVNMLNSFVAYGIRFNHPPHILLNLQAKESDPDTYRKLERFLGRPPLLTTGVMPNAIAETYQWVPERLAFRLYADSERHELPPAEIPPRPLDLSRRYDPVTRGVIARYAEFWRWRGDYLKLHQDCQQAIEHYQRALRIIPDLTEANEGLSECVEVLLKETPNN